VKLLAIAVLLLVTLAVRPAAADPFARHVRPGTSPSSTTSIIVPAEWAGVWENCDTVYTCAGAFQSASCDTDTLCTGQVFDTDPSISCSGSFTSTTYTEHCTGSGNILTCQYTTTIDSHGTRTADSSFSVSTISTTYSGADPTCGFLPPQCAQINSHGNRLGPAPAAYCATPSQPTTWGQMKAHYR
jgi:hypothetical protein